MAQDFQAAFKVGEDDKHITTIDSEGAALAAIQGLYKMIEERDATITAQAAKLNLADQEIHALQAKTVLLENAANAISVLKARLDRIERRDPLLSASAR